MDLEAVRRTGIAAAYRGAGVLLSRFGRIERIRRKGAKDLVTEADTGAEQAIIESIRHRFPGHGILAEESAPDQDAGGAHWIIDPLDGTTNYAHRLGIFSVSVAFAVEAEILVGVVLDPLKAELFTAVRRRGARLNGRPISVSETRAVSESLLVTGFPYEMGTGLDQTIARFSRCLTAAQGMRRLGSAALDLCYVACGRFEGFWESDLKPWDTAAGVLIAREAGATVTDYRNQKHRLESGELLATNGRIHPEMISLLSLEETE